MTGLVPPGPLAEPQARRREQRAWYFQDRADSAYVTTTGTVLLVAFFVIGFVLLLRVDVRRGIEVAASAVPPIV